MCKCKLCGKEIKNPLYIRDMYICKDCLENLDTKIVKFANTEGKHSIKALEEFKEYLERQYLEKQRYVEEQLKVMQKLVDETEKVTKIEECSEDVKKVLYTGSIGFADVPALLYYKGGKVN